jgi:DNA (cytosine-5)-methyltransferase 1
MYTLTENDVHAVAFQQNTRDEVRLLNGDGQIAGALAAEAGMKQQNYIAQPVPIQDGREIDKAQNGMGIGRQGDPAYTIDTTGAQAVAFSCKDFGQGDVRATMAVVNMQGSKSNACVATDGSCFTLTEMHGHDVHAVAFSCKDAGQDASEVSPTLRAMTHDQANPNGGGQVAVAFTTEQTPKFQNECALTLTKQSPTGGGQPQAVAHGVQVQWASGGGQVENNTAQALRSNAEHNYQFARIAMTVRRLTPVECERLQGFPDNYTLIPWRKKPAADCPDGPRYKALGNSMAVNCMEWIGERIAACDGATA